jgi:microcystin-dependent protein
MKTACSIAVFVMALCLMTAFLVFAQPQEAHADPFIGEIRMVSFTFCPQGWAAADGQLLAINQNPALFSLFGTMYGGDGMTTFALPDLRGRVPIHAGAGPGLTPRNLGSRSGTEAVTLSESQMPSHTHTINAYSLEGDSAVPTGNIRAKSGAGDPDYSSSAPDTTMDAGAASNTGGGQSHNNMPPFLAIQFCVAVQGLYPSLP